MQPVLILKETEKITEHKAYLAKCILPLQTFYDQFKAIDVSVTLADLLRLSYYQNSTQAKSQIDDYVGDKMIEKAGTPDFGGVKIKQSKLREMLDLPNTANLIKGSQTLQDFTNSNMYSSNGMYGIDPKYFEIVNDTVAIKADAFAAIEARYTHYTENDFGAVLVTKLNAIIPTLTGLGELLSPRMADSYKRDLDFSQIGIENKDSNLRPSLRFVREQEKGYPNYVAS